jgi:chromosome segregation ATPase
MSNVDAYPQCGTDADKLAWHERRHEAAHDALDKAGVVGHWNWWLEDRVYRLVGNMKRSDDAVQQRDEARASLKQALQERDYERARADGNWKYCRQYEDERNKAEAEIGRIKNLLEHVKADRELIRNAGLQADKERDEAQLLNQELKTELNHALVELHQARAEVAQLRDTAAAYEQATVNQQLTVRADPSRLEIAAMIYSNLRGTSIARAMVAADELIAAAREGK